MRRSFFRMMSRVRYIVPLLLIFVGVVAQAQELTAVSAKTLALIKVRGGAGPEYPVLTTLAFNTDIIIEARNAIGNWFLVRQEDLSVRGWVASRYIAWDDTNAPLPNLAVSYEILQGSDAATGQVVTNPDATPFPTTTPSLINLSGTLAKTRARVNLRNAADFNGGIISLVLYDVTVSIQGRNARGNWLLVETADGQRGWIAARYLKWEDGVDLASFAVSTEVMTPDAAVTLVADAATVIAPSGAIATAAVSTQTADGAITATVLVATFNIRAAPDETSRRLNQARMGDLVYIEARNARGDWLLIRTAGDPAYRGWTASRFIGWSDTIPLATIPVSVEIIGGQP